MQIKAKYKGTCKKCSLPIEVGDMIDWERGRGASHVKCPEKENEREKLEKKLKEIESQVFVTPTVESEDDFIVKLYYYDGEYLSGYTSNAYDILEALNVSKYVSGWGSKVDNDLVKDLGLEFTVLQAKEYAIPKLEEAFNRERDVEMKKIEAQLEKFNEAKKTGKTVVLERWSEECNDPREECDIDNITVYANPDGTTTTSRSHSW